MTKTNDPGHPEAGRAMALDVGDKRIGVAMTDGLGLTAQPLLTVWRTTAKADRKSLGRLIRRHGVSTLIVGRPLHADGSPSPQSVKTEAFAAELFAEHPAVEGVLLDERLTTREAHALLDEAGGGRRTAADRQQRAAVIDQVAAVLLLEAWMSQRQGVALLPDPDA